MIDSGAIFAELSATAHRKSNLGCSRLPPLTVTISSAGRRVLFNGWLDNKAELASELGCPTADSAAIYGAAVDRWGDEADLKAIGSYCSIVFAPKSRSARLCRSPWSAPPLHFYTWDGGLAVASVPRALHVCGAPRELDEQKLADNLYANLTEERGWYRDMRQVLLGTVVELSPTGQRTIKYYDHLALRRTQLATDRDYADAAGALLNDAAACAISGAREPGVLLSGGLDSASVATYLLDQLPGRRLKTFTFTPHKDWDGRIDGNYFGDDRPFVDEFAKMHPRIDPTFCDNAGSDATSRLEPMIRAMGIAPIGLPNMYMFHGLYEQASAKGVDVICSADMGNRTFSNEGSWAAVEYLLSGQLRQLYKALRNVSPGNGSLFEIFIRRSLLPLLPDRAWQMWQRWRGNDLTPANQRIAMMRADTVMQHGLEERARKAGVLFQRPYLRSRRQSIVDSFARGDMGGADVDQGFEQLYGVRTRDVTSYRPFVEFCLGLPTNMFMRDGEDRWLARRMAIGRLPHGQRTNRQQGFHNVDWHTRMTPRLREIRGLVDQAARTPEVAALIDVEGLRRTLDDWPSHGSVKSETYVRFAMAIPRAIMTAQFIRFATGRNTP